ncbi:chaperonin 10-like protein [Zopfochytrium polystomum]|nr:chaperonin 10-like protein [Zopfochytrium polystomum]
MSAIPAVNRALVAEFIKSAQVVRNFPHDPAALADHEVVVKIHSAGLNPVDWKVLKSGLLVPAESYPHVFGCDGAGTIVAVGAAAAVTHKVGDRVFYQAKIGDRRTSAFQQYAVVDHRFVYGLPENASFDEGATFGVAAFTAAASLYSDLKAPQWWKGEPPVAAGHFLLIWGGATAVGQAAIQLAHRAGYTVITTASPANHVSLRALGAAYTLDYRSPTVAADIRALTGGGGELLRAAIDTVGAASAVVFDLLATRSPATLVLVAGDVAAIEALPQRRGFPLRSVVRAYGSSWGPGNAELAAEFWPAFVQAVAAGEYRAQAVRVVAGGLGGVEAAQREQMEGRVSNFKFVVHPHDE